MNTFSSKSLFFFLPIFNTIWIAFSLTTSYIIAAKFGHITTSVPYLSGIVKYLPEEMFAKIAFTIAAGLDVLTYYSMYKYQKISHPKSSQVCNIIVLILGLLSSLGLLLGTHVSSNISTTVHLVAAFLAFGLEAVYNICHCIRYYRSVMWKDHRYMITARLVLCLITTVPTIMFVVFKQISCPFLKICDYNFITPASPDS
ncbi:modulator of macroautophagy TMEM150B-like [Xenopus tropicalis]|uniref:Modulator of macroautophagy TMEM150B-like n=1 Tax=Xenopus tropicalis TaxID=8364 RepID=A0A8J1JZB3_XENTR|nr:modulator of macroautophagy TMEM150B-like [Xenopus tropicalis]